MTRALHGTTNDRSNFQMRYFGLRGGLEVMRSVGDEVETGSSFGERLCSGQGGEGWRNAKLTEIAMLLTAPSATGITLSIAGSSGTPAGYADAENRQLALTFPALSASETAITDSAHIGLVNDYSDPYRMEVANDGSGVLERSRTSITRDDSETWFCVRETDAYNPSEHHHLSALRIGDETYDTLGTGLLNEVGARTAPQSATRSAFTITAHAWYFGDIDQDFAIGLHTNLPSEPISVRLNDSADSSTYELLATPVNGQRAFWRLCCF